jgi:hypothetical protein
MSYNSYNLDYELDDLNVNIYNRAELNKLTIAEGEDLNHFSGKAMMFYYLSGELNHDVITDYHIIGVGNVDLYDLSARTIYQFEDENSIDELQLIKNDILFQKIVDVIIIHLEDLPDDIFQRYIKLREYVISE